MGMKKYNLIRLVQGQYCAKFVLYYMYVECTENHGFTLKHFLCQNYEILTGQKIYSRKNKLLSNPSSPEAQAHDIYFLDTH
jgi:hypothetical protein